MSNIFRLWNGVGMTHLEARTLKVSACTEKKDQQDNLLFEHDIIHTKKGYSVIMAGADGFYLHNSPCTKLEFLESSDILLVGNMFQNELLYRSVL